jgi:protein-L-isoaspartate(D-aspartate) O-methyltransferase
MSADAEAKIGELGRRGLLRSERLRRAMLTVAREDFVPSDYRDHASEEIQLPLPGERAAISCPHSYPLFCDPLGLAARHRLLEVGVGSGYGTAPAPELVGRDGLVVAVDLDAATLGFARENLDGGGYTDVVLVHGDGGLGYAEHAPYDRICVTAACSNTPPPLIEQLEAPGRLIAPVKEGTRQQLTLLERPRPACGARSSRTSCTSRPVEDTAVAAVGSTELCRRPRPVLRRQRAGARPRSFKSAMRWPTSCDCAIRARVIGDPARTSLAASAAHSNKRVASVARRGGSCPRVRSGVNSGASHPSRDSPSPPQRPSDAG